MAADCNSSRLFLIFPLIVILILIDNLPITLIKIPQLDVYFYFYVRFLRVLVSVATIWIFIDVYDFC